MAYSTLTAPSTSLTAPLGKALTAVRDALKVALDTVARAMLINSTAHLRIQQVERLQSKSDAELAELGLERNQIVHAVFQDLF